jgi:oligosaccharyltransferase complex subunit gamma
MRFLTSLFAPLLLSSTNVLVNAAKDSDRFASALSKTYPLKLNDAKFGALTAAPRDYSVMILLTALESRFGCNACQDFQPEWDVLGRSWQKGDRKGESKVVFGTLDFVDGKDTFMSLGLQHAPVIMLYPATTGKNAKTNAAPIRFDFTA